MGQHSGTKSYSLRKEYGLHGAVKEVSTYLCKVNKQGILSDTGNAFGKYKLTFDEQGNGQINYRKRTNENGAVIIYEMIYAGKGKNVTYKERIIIDGKQVEEAGYKYVWSDDLSYKIVKQNDTSDVQIFTLNNNFRIINFKLKQGDVEHNYKTDELIKNNRVEKTITLNENAENEITKSFDVMVMKEFDEHNNPTKIYSYDNLDEKNPIVVVFKQYKYYK
ncbi:hypothetical protein [Pedobacter sp. D749]|uniref:hypothetical protein n=1 Tax=Pedobacter sp. D749 TaxID=2856523 RepID=UPI001C58E198|nr:hypothetical protein [Pedobacter sp. D749]QXU41144.1 hypothetical protein KYH19_19410 [Pedobacter sp. D749]